MSSRTGDPTSPPWAGLRAKPERLEKNDLDSWHKPKRVDVVLADPFFETLAEPPRVEDELRRNIALFALNERNAAAVSP